MSNLTDWALIKKANSGNRSAFDELVARYEKKVYNLSCKMLGAEEDAKDALQETFLSAFKALDSFKGKSSFSTWLYRIATNVCLMKIRKKSFGLVSLDKLLDIEPVDGSNSLSTTIDRDELKKVLDSAIKSLPEMYRTVFILRDINGLSISETASVLKLSVPTVKSRLHRARSYLRDKVSKYMRGEVVRV
jgi:RNA polymerase sigma-70 factor (ECF subfamily)